MIWQASRPRISKGTRGGGCVEKAIQPAALDLPLLLSRRILPFKPDDPLMADNRKKRNRIDSGPISTLGHKKVKLVGDDDNDATPSESQGPSAGLSNNNVSISVPV